MTDCKRCDVLEQTVRALMSCADGQLVLTLRPALGPANELKVPPWAELAVIEAVSPAARVEELTVT